MSKFCNNKILTCEFLHINNKIKFMVLGSCDSLAAVLVNGDAKK